MSDSTQPRDKREPVDPDPAVWGENDDESSFGFLQLAQIEARAPARKRQRAAPLFDAPGLLQHAPATDSTTSRLRLDSAVRGVPHEMWSEWEQGQWNSLRLFMRMCQVAIRPSSAPKKRAEALRWCFGREPAEGALRLTFGQACHALEVRPYVMQSAVHHHLFRRGIVLDEPVCADAHMHSSFNQDAEDHGGSANGPAVAADVWRYPSRGITQVIAALTAAGIDDADQTIAGLVHYGILGLSAGRVWFTGRSPAVMDSRHASFARSFLEPQEETSFLDGYGLTASEHEVLFGTGGDYP